MKDLVNAAIRRIEENHTRQGMLSGTQLLSAGFPSQDDHLICNEGEMIVTGGAAEHGRKTSFAMNIAENVGA